VYVAPQEADAPPLLVAVIGAGIGGCALALALQQRGVPVRVFESDASFDARSQGYGLTLQQGNAALSALGIRPSPVLTSSSHTSYTPDGSVLGAYGREVRERGAAEPGSERGKHNFHWPRQALRAALLRGLAPGTVTWGARFESYSEGRPEEGVQLTFAGGHTMKTSVLVGADGIRSAVRRQKLAVDPAPLRYLGLMVVLGIAPSDHAAVDGRIVQVLDGSTRIYAMPHDAGRAMWQLSFPIGEAEATALGRRGAEGLRGEARSRCTGWLAPIPQLIEGTEEGLITGYGAYDRDTLRADALRGHAASLVTLLGDAAHPMSPFKGQGANQALLDGVSLARRLYAASRRPACDGAVLASALAEFEAEMLRRAAVKVALSREAAGHLHSAAAVRPADCTRAAAARLWEAEEGGEQ
jgi:2-polyprenyl-6-methoxyphenol hydroxylase-like FAD-dependent oxidoreductase